jgi:ABC-type transport system involved in multi-copper enzyme maturation permease subunit
MDAPTPAPVVKINRWLPYWAVFQADLRQTLRSWVYRTWVSLSVLAAVGYLLYRVGVYREAGIIQYASALISDLLRWSVLGSVTLVIILTAGSISSERGTLADSVLSRGISRYQYFLGKWHARLAAVLATFLVMGVAALAGSYFFLHEDLSPGGSLLAVATVLALLAAVVTCGVTVSAVVNNTLLAVTVLWVFLYGIGFALSLLPASLPTPDRVLNTLPYMLQGHYDLPSLGRLLGWALGASLGVALTGLVYFAWRDV